MNRFIDDARKLGLDTKDANDAFERAFSKIAPPKKKGDAPNGNQERDVPSKND